MLLLQSIRSKIIITLAKIVELLRDKNRLYNMYKTNYLEIDHINSR